MPSSTSASNQAAFILSDLGAMSFDSRSRLGTIAEGDCESSVQSSVSMPSFRKGSWINKKTHDLEQASRPSCTETTTESIDGSSNESAGRVISGDICSFLGTSRITFSLSKCNILLSMIALVFLLAIGYKWNGFLVALIIVVALLIHFMIIWWLNDEGFFFPAREEDPTMTTKESGMITNTTKSKQSLAEEADLEFGKDKGTGSSPFMAARLQ
jgi:hypothetical protein